MPTVAASSAPDNTMSAINFFGTEFADGSPGGDAWRAVFPPARRRLHTIEVGHYLRPVGTDELASAVSAAMRCRTG